MGMNKQELITKIGEWEEYMGESFNDYFTHDNVSDQSWSFYLLGRGIIRANRIIRELVKGNDCIDQELLYDIRPYLTKDGDHHPKWRENYEYNMGILADFLLATEYYTEKITKFFEEYDRLK